MSGDQAEVEKKEPLFWPLNLLPGLTHMAAFYGQLPANFRFSGALAMAGAVLALVSKMVLETKPVSLLLNSVDQDTL